MEVRGIIPRLASSILQDISRLQKELHRRAAIDEEFRRFIYSRENYPFRVLGFTEPARDIDEVRREWEETK